MRRRILWCALAVELLLLVGVWLQQSGTRPASFDRAVWRAGEDAPFNSDAPRLRMANGLIASGELLGRTRAELEAMLGPPSNTSKFREYRLVYWLGPERGFVSIDSEWLSIRFNERQQVADVRIVRD
jgi:hypothetical protein